MKPRARILQRRAACVGAPVLLAGLLGLRPRTALAASLSPRDLQVLGRALAFLLPPLSSQTRLAVAYAAADAASRQDAEAIANSLGDGLRVGAALLQPVLTEIGTVASGGFRVVIAAAGASGPLLAAAARGAHTLCATAEFDAVQTGGCTMAIRSEPRVEIVVNHAAAAAAGVEFATAFRMMIREI